MPVELAEVLLLRRRVKSHQHRLPTLTIDHLDSSRLYRGVELTRSKHLNDGNIKICRAQKMKTRLIHGRGEEKVGNPNGLAGTADSLQMLSKRRRSFDLPGRGVRLQKRRQIKQPRSSAKEGGCLRATLSSQGV